MYLRLKKKKALSFVLYLHFTRLVSLFLSFNNLPLNFLNFNLINKDISITWNFISVKSQRQYVIHINIKKCKMFHHCAFQAVEEQSLPQWGPEAQSEGQEAEFLIHLMWSVVSEVKFQFIRMCYSSTEINHCYSQCWKLSGAKVKNCFFKLLPKLFREVKVAPVGSPCNNKSLSREQCDLVQLYCWISLKWLYVTFSLCWF